MGGMVVVDQEVQAVGMDWPAALDTVVACHLIESLE